MIVRKKTILFITGTRAEWGLFRSTILLLKKSSIVTPKILVTGMHTQRQFGYTLDEVRREVNVDHTIPIGEHDDQVTALSKEIEGIGKYLKKNPVDALLVVGDRDEPFAGAVVAVHLGIPIIHIAGGDVTGPTVDQYLRNAITTFSSVHLTQTPHSASNVKKLGADPRWTKNVGPPGLDQLKRSELFSRKEVARLCCLDAKKQWFLVSMHPTILDNTPILQQIRSVLTAIKKISPDDEKILLYPNADDGCDTFIAEIEKMREKSNFHINRHLKRMDYLSLMKESAALIGNTSSGLMEAGYLKVPFVCVGNRQKYREHGSNVLFADYDSVTIEREITKALSSKFRKSLTHSQSIYKGGAVAKRIAKAIEQFLLTL
ncbi:MAG: UDP-N-acetylglucosamine 2-epimerase [Kiritimatiellales bacterium]|nr:UDP-N-acetylglucosamine 2-epimerase [Kiritimatiellales bacterium]